MIGTRLIKISWLNRTLSRGWQLRIGNDTRGMKWGHGIARIRIGVGVSRYCLFGYQGAIALTSRKDGAG